MVLQVKYRPLEGNKARIEAPFWNHLITLKEGLKDEMKKLKVALIEVDEQYEQKFGSGWITVDPDNDGIELESLYNLSALQSSRFSRLMRFGAVYKKIGRLVKNADLVHTGLSHDILLPSSFFAVINAILKKKKLIYIVDIDFRNSSRMLYEAGHMNFISYIRTKLFYDVHKFLQLITAIRYADLSLLKGKKFASDFAKIGKNVKYFFDTIHDNQYILSKDKIEAKIDSVRNKEKGLKIVYFGRISEYKGVQDAIEAISKIKDASGHEIELTIIGNGDYLPEIENLVAQLKMSDCVSISPPISFGKDLFDEISKHDILIALPQREDTPRSAFDAMAAGLSILAYDTDYYKELSESGAVITTKWRDIDLLANSLLEIAAKRDRLAEPCQNAVYYAKDHTQARWMDRRLKWTKEILCN